MTRLDESSMNAFRQQRIAAVGMLLVQASAMVILMGSYVFPACIALLAIARLLTPHKRWSISLPGDRWILFLGGLFFLKFYFAPHQVPFNRQFIFSSFCHEVAAFSLVAELLFLFRRENELKLTGGYLVFAVLGFIFTANVRLNSFRRIAMLIMVQLFLLCWMYFSMKSRREVQPVKKVSQSWRYAVMTLVLLLAAGAGTTTSVLLHKNERALETLLTTVLKIGDRGPARSGFSNRGGLSDVSSWRDFGGEKLSLRIESEIDPGYVRGKVFDEFNMNRWTLTTPSQKIIPEPANSIPAELSNQLAKGEYLYLLAKRFPAETTKMKVWPIDNETAGHCFAPLDTAALITRSRPVGLDRANILTRPGEQRIISYSVFTADTNKRDRNRKATDQVDLNHYLQLPSLLDARVRTTARELFASANTPREKIQATSSFFHQNFLYHKGIQIPRGEDRLGYFLESQSAAHCEYFATATAILLRLGGVPTRYVTGFYVQEKNPLDGSWLARRKDAHAWVEAYDNQRKEWVQVESTPADGLPQPSQATDWELRRESINHYIRKLQEAMVGGNYLGVLWQIMQPILLLATCIVTVGLLTWLLTRKKLRRPNTALTESQFHHELISERKKFDIFLSKQGLERMPEETMLQLSKRLRSDPSVRHSELLADWCLDYSSLRYRTDYSLQDIQRLRLKRVEIEKMGKKASKQVTQHV